MKRFVTAAAAAAISAVMLCGVTVYADDGVYENITEFAEDGGIYSLPSEAVSEADSKSYGFEKSFEGAEEFYLAASSVMDDEIIMSVSEDGIYMKLLTNDPEEGMPADMTIIIKGNTMYMLDNDAKTGYTMSAEGLAEELDADGMMEEFAGMSMVDPEADIKVCTVNIGGKDYTFEHDGLSMGILFDGDKIYAIVDGSEGVLMIDEFTADVPDGIFEIPADYYIEDLSVALYGESEPAPDETAPTVDTANTVSPLTGNAPTVSAAVTAAAMLAVMAMTFKRTRK